MNGILFSVFIVTCLWGGWPLVARASGLPPLWMAIVGTTGGALAVWFSVLIFPVRLGTFPSTQSFALGFVASVMLGLGMFWYSGLLMNAEISKYIPIVAGCITAITVIGGMMFFQEPVTLSKGMGIVLVIIGIVLLN